MKFTAPQVLRAPVVVALVMGLQLGCADVAEKSSPPAEHSARLAGDAKAAAPSPGDKAAAAADPRKIRRSGRLRLTVTEIRGTTDALVKLTGDLGGFVQSSQVEGDARFSHGSLTLRVPAGRFDEAMAGIEKLALKVNSAETSAQDVTAEYVDLEARLKNLRLEEGQLQQLLSRAGSMEDTLKVTQTLSEVRGRIEQLQGELQLLSRQVEMSDLTVDYFTEPGEAQQRADWRMGRRVRDGWAALTGGLADYLGLLIGFLMRLPLILLWGVTILFFLSLGWRLFKLIWRRFDGASRRS